MFTKIFVLDTLERIIRSFAGGVAAQWVVGSEGTFSIAGLEYGLAAAGASLIFALAGKPFGGNKDTGSVL